MVTMRIVKDESELIVPLTFQDGILRSPRNRTANGKHRDSEYWSGDG